MQAVRPLRSTLRAELEHLLAPLAELSGDPRRLDALLEQRGWNSARLAAALDRASLAAALGAAHAALLAALAEEAQALGLVRRLARALHLDEHTCLAPELASALAEDLLHEILVDYLERRAPELLLLGRFLDALRTERAERLTAAADREGATLRRAQERATLRPRRLMELAQDPFGCLGGESAAPSFAALGSALAERLRALAEPVAAPLALHLQPEIARIRGPDAGSARRRAPLVLALPFGDELELALHCEASGELALRWRTVGPAPAMRPLFEERGWRVQSGGGGGGDAGLRALLLVQDEDGPRLELQGLIALRPPSALLATPRGAPLQLVGEARAHFSPLGAELRVESARGSARALVLPGGIVLHDVEARALRLRFPLPPAPDPGCALELEGEIELGGQRVRVRARRDESGFELESVGALRFEGGPTLFPHGGECVLRLRAEERDRSRRHRAEVRGALFLPHAGASVPIALAGALELEERGGALRILCSSVASQLEPAERLLLPGRIELGELWVGLAVERNARGPERVRAELSGRIRLGSGGLELLECALSFPDPQDPRVVELKGSGAASELAFCEEAELVDLCFCLEASSRTGEGRLCVQGATAGLYPRPGSPGSTRRDRYELFVEELEGEIRFGARGATLHAGAGRMQLPDAYELGAGSTAVDLAQAASPLVVARGARAGAHCSGSFELGSSRVELSAHGSDGAACVELEHATLVLAGGARPRVEEAEGALCFRPGASPEAPALRIPFAGWSWDLAELPEGEIELAREVDLELGEGFVLRLASAGAESGRAARVLVARDDQGHARLGFDGQLELRVPPRILHRVERPDEAVVLAASTRFTLSSAPGARARVALQELCAEGRFRLGPAHEGLLVLGERPHGEARLRTVELENAFAPTPAAPFVLALEGGICFAPPGPQLALEGARLVFSGPGRPVRLALPGFALPPAGAPLFAELPLMLVRADLELGPDELPLAERIAPGAIHFVLEAELELPAEHGGGRGRASGIEVHVQGGRPELALERVVLAVEGCRPAPGIELGGELALLRLESHDPRRAELFFGGTLRTAERDARASVRIAFHPRRPVDLRIELEQLRGALSLAEGELALFGGRGTLARSATREPAQLELEGLLVPCAQADFIALAGSLRLEPGVALEHAGELLLCGRPVGDASGRFTLERRRAGSQLAWQADARLCVGPLVLGPARLGARFAAAALAQALERDGPEPPLPRLLGRLLASGAAGRARVAEALRESASELALELSGSGAARLRGLALSGELAPFVARAQRGLLEALTCFDPRRCLEEALGGARLFARTDWAVLRAELAFPTALEETGALALAAAAADPEALRAELGERLASAERDARFELELELSPLGLALRELAARLVTPAAAPAPTLAPEGALRLLARLHADGALRSADWRLASAESAGPEQLSRTAAAESLGTPAPHSLLDLFPAGGLVACGLLVLPRALAEGAPLELTARCVDSNAPPRARRRALLELIELAECPSTTRARLALHVPAELSGGAPRGSLCGELEGRLLGLPIAPALLRGVTAQEEGEGGLDLSALPAPGSWLAELAGDAPLRFELRRAPDLPLEHGLGLLRALARRRSSRRSTLQAELERVRARVARGRAELRARHGSLGAQLEASRPPALAFLRGEIDALAANLAGKRARGRERALADHIAGALARSLPRVALRARIASPRLPEALAPVVRVVPGSEALLCAHSPLFDPDGTELAGASALRRARALGGIALRADLELGAGLGLAARIPGAELALLPDPEERLGPRFVGGARVARLPLPFGLPPLEEAVVEIETTQEGGLDVVAPGGLRITGRSAGRTVELSWVEGARGNALRGSIRHALALRNLDLGPIRLPGEARPFADRIRLDTRLDALCELELCADGARATLSGELEWNGWSWGIPELVLDPTVDGSRALAARVAAHLCEHAAEVFGEAALDHDFWLRALQSGAIGLADQSALAIVRALRARGLELGPLVEACTRAGFELCELASALALECGEEALPEVVAALGSARGARALAEVAAAALAAFGMQRADRIALALVQSGGARAPRPLAQALLAAEPRLALGTVGRALLEAFPQAPRRELVAALAGAVGAGRAGEAARALRAALEEDVRARPPRAGKGRAGSALEALAGGLLDALGRGALTPVAEALLVAHGAAEAGAIAGALRRAQRQCSLERLARALAFAPSAPGLELVARALREGLGASPEQCARALARCAGRRRLVELARALRAAYGATLDARALVLLLARSFRSARMPEVASAARAALGEQSLGPLARALRQVYRGERPASFARALRACQPEPGAAELARALAEAGMRAPDVLRALRRELADLAPGQQLDTLAAAGLSWKEVLRNGARSLSLPPAELAAWSLASRSASAAQIAAALRDQRFSLEEVARSLGAAGVPAPKLARALRTSFGARPRAIAAALEAAGPAPKE